MIAIGRRKPLRRGQCQRICLDVRRGGAVTLNVSAHGFVRSRGATSARLRMLKRCFSNTGDVCTPPTSFRRAYTSCHSASLSFSRELLFKLWRRWQCVLNAQCSSSSRYLLVQKDQCQISGESIHSSFSLGLGGLCALRVYIIDFAKRRPFFLSLSQLHVCLSLRVSLALFLFPRSPSKGWPKAPTPEEAKRSVGTGSDCRRSIIETYHTPYPPHRRRDVAACPR